MNRELIERIDHELDQRDLVGQSMFGTGFVQSARDIAIGKILADCKAALSQAEPVSVPSELEMHRADYSAIKAAGFDSPGELLAAYNTLTKSVPQDVEEFIAAHDYDKEDMCSGCVPSSALREWMAGHARVPVEPTHSMGIAGNAILPSCVNSDEVYKAMLAASQQEVV